MAAKKKAKKISATDLRLIAESADGTRGQDVYLEATPGTIRRIQKPSAGKPAVGKSTVVVRTNWHGAGLRATGKISVTGCSKPVPSRADAVFTSQSSFEKFALPYYVRTKTLPELKKMLNKFYKRGVVCIYHEPESDSGTGGGGTKGSGLRLLYKDGSIGII
jgi:hypothetical protein